MLAITYRCLRTSCTVRTLIARYPLRPLRMRQQGLSPMLSSGGDDPSPDFRRLAKEFRERRSLVHTSSRTPKSANATTPVTPTTTPEELAKQQKTAEPPPPPPVVVGPSTSCCQVSLPKIVSLPEQQRQQEEVGKSASSPIVAPARRRKKRRRPPQCARTSDNSSSSSSSSSSNARKPAVHHDDDDERHHPHPHHHHHFCNKHAVAHSKANVAPRSKNRCGSWGDDEEGVIPYYLGGASSACRALFGPPSEYTNGVGRISAQNQHTCSVGMMSSVEKEKTGVGKLSMLSSVSGIRRLYRTQHNEQQQQRQQEGGKNRATLEDVRRSRRRRRSSQPGTTIPLRVPVLSAPPLCERQARILSSHTEYIQQQPGATARTCEEGRFGGVGVGACGHHRGRLAENHWGGDHRSAVGIGGSQRRGRCVPSSSCSSGDNNNNVVDGLFQAASDDADGDTTSFSSSRNGDDAATSAIRWKPPRGCTSRPTVAAAVVQLPGGGEDGNTPQEQRQGAVVCDHHLDWRRALLDDSYAAGLVRDLKQTLRAGRSAVLRAREDQPPLGYTDRADCQLMLRTLYMQCVRVSTFRLHTVCIRTESLWLFSHFTLST